MKVINFRECINPIWAKRARYKKICQLVKLKPSHKVLNVGCGEGLSFEVFNKTNKIVGLDIFPKSKIFQRNFSYVQGDGTNMSIFGNKQFDLVVCIGVLEHIFPFHKLKKVISGIQRVGKRYIVIVPHYYTPLEPHSQLFFWQHYPDTLKSFLIKHMSVGYFKKNHQGEFEKLHYFKKEKWQSFFPGSEVVSYNHLLMGLIKNYIIFKITAF